jgi:hypothetical protein
MTPTASFIENDWFRNFYEGGTDRRDYVLLKTDHLTTLFQLRMLFYNVDWIGKMVMNAVQAKIWKKTIMSLFQRTEEAK